MAFRRWMRRYWYHAAAVGTAAVVGTVTYGMASSPSSSTNSPSASSPATATTSVVTSGCHVSADGGPDTACTPGVTDSRVTQANIQQTICVPGYTKTVRATTQATKDAVLAAYGLQRPWKGEIDHLISLELGGADVQANLWPEAGAIPNPKDHEENVLHAEVCAGTITLAQAQDTIRHWQAGWRQ